MKLTKRTHLCLVKELGTFAAPQHVLIEAFTAADAKEYACRQYPNSNVLVLESR